MLGTGGRGPLVPLSRLVPLGLQPDTITQRRLSLDETPWIPYTRHVTNATVCKTSSLLTHSSETVPHVLQVCGKIAGVDVKQDHQWVKLHSSDCPVI